MRRIAIAELDHLATVRKQSSGVLSAAFRPSAFFWTLDIALKPQEDVHSQIEGRSGWLLIAAATQQEIGQLIDSEGKYVDRSAVDGVLTMHQGPEAMRCSAIA